MLQIFRITSCLQFDVKSLAVPLNFPNPLHFNFPQPRLGHVPSCNPKKARCHLNVVAPRGLQTSQDRCGRRGWMGRAGPLKDVGWLLPQQQPVRTSARDECSGRCCDVASIPPPRPHLLADSVRLLIEVSTSVFKLVVTWSCKKYKFFFREKFPNLEKRLVA